MPKPYWHETDDAKQIEKCDSAMFDFGKYLRESDREHESRIVQRARLDMQGIDRRLRDAHKHRVEAPTDAR